MRFSIKRSEPYIVPAEVLIAINTEEQIDELVIEPGPITKENYRQTQRTLKEAAQRILDATGLDKPRCDQTRQVKYVLPRPDSLEFLVG